MKKLLILFSGGADSLLMLALAKDLGHEVHTLTFSYGQKHSEEVEYARKQITLNHQMQHYVDLGEIFKNFNSNLLKDSQANYPGVHPAHVPARNTIFLAVAMGLAETHGYDEIWHGADYSDRLNLFPDCYQEYFVKMNTVAQVAGSKPITIRAPLLGLTKEEVIELLQKRYGVDMRTVFTGYNAPAELPKE